MELTAKVNQYSASLKSVIEQKCAMSLKEALLKYKSRGFTYKKVAEDVHFKEATIRKYCRMYKIVLEGSNNNGVKLELNALKDELKKPLNKFNILSSQWVNFRKFNPF